MVKAHHIIDQSTWPMTCDDCNMWIAYAKGGEHGGGLWQIYDGRAAQLVRTGLLAPWLTRVTWIHAEKDTRDGPRGDWTDTRGVMLILVAHHHQRGMRIPITEALWEAASTLTCLAGPWAGARLLLDAAVSA